MATILGANSLTGAYQVENSMMLETGDSSRLSKTFSSASNSNTTFTVSAWFKKTKLARIVPSGISSADRWPHSATPSWKRPEPRTSSPTIQRS